MDDLNLWDFKLLKFQIREHVQCRSDSLDPTLNRKCPKSIETFFPPFLVHDRRCASFINQSRLNYYYLWSMQHIYQTVVQNSDFGTHHKIQQEGPISHEFQKNACFYYLLFVKRNILTEIINHNACFQSSINVFSIHLNYKEHIYNFTIYCHDHQINLFSIYLNLLFYAGRSEEQEIGSIEPIFRRIFFFV